MKKVSSADAKHHNDTAGGNVKKSVTLDKGPPQTQEIPANPEPAPAHPPRTPIRLDSPGKSKGDGKVKKTGRKKTDPVAERMEAMKAVPARPQFGHDHILAPPPRPTHDEKGVHLASVRHRAVANAIKEDNKKP